MSTLPLTFHGAVRYPLNLLSAIGQAPKGFVVLLYFDEGLVPDGVQKFQLAAQVRASVPGIASNYLCVGLADFGQSTFNFESDRPPLRFTGSIDASVPRIQGTIEIDCISKPYKIEFLPFSDS